MNSAEDDVNGKEATRKTTSTAEIQKCKPNERRHLRNHGSFTFKFYDQGIFIVTRTILIILIILII